MKRLLTWRWGFICMWIVVGVLLTILAPSMQNLVREQGQISVPEGYPSSEARELLEEHQGEEEGGDALIAVFTKEEGLTADNRAAILATLTSLQKNGNDIRLQSLTSSLDGEEVASQLESEDGTTMLAMVTVDDATEETVKTLRAQLETDGVESYVTGERLINDDVISNSEEGLKKTEWLTVAFILIVLLVVFRSFVAPLVPLLTVGVTYIVSQSIVAILIDQFSFPVSTFTQTFMVAILFGIGTDYCILLLSRYKEELANGLSTDEAILVTFHHAGKTVLYSGIAVLIGFISIGFSQFSLYQSAVAVAVGIACLLVALFTLVPFFLKVAGNRLFWPFSGQSGHGESRLWKAIGTFSTGKPLLTLLFMAIVLVPVLWSYDGNLSFNSMDEIGDDVESSYAFQVISDHYAPGETFATQVVLETSESFQQADWLPYVDELTSNLAVVPGVDRVRSLTRPLGESLEDLTLQAQMGEVESGLSDGSTGLGEITSGLQTAQDELSDSQPELETAVSQLSQLVSGTGDVRSGVLALQNGLEQLYEGGRQGVEGSQQLAQGLSVLEESAAELAVGAEQLAVGISQATEGLTTLSTQYVSIADNFEEMTNSAVTLSEQLAEVEERYPELEQDDSFQQVKEGLASLARQMETARRTFVAVNEQLQAVNTSLQEGATQLATFAAGQQRMSEGLARVTDELGAFQAGLENLSIGQAEIIAQLPQLAEGLTTISSGQQQFQTGMAGLQGDLAQLTNGLEESVSGMTLVRDGLEEAGGYLQGVSDQQSPSYVYVPEDVLDSEEVQPLFDQYTSPDRKLMTMDVVLQEDPYSEEAMAIIANIEDTIKVSLRGTPFEDAKVAIGGVTSENADLQAVSSADYVRTIIFMTVAIAIVLWLLFRSIALTLTVLASLLVTYWTSLAVAEWIFTAGMGYPGLSWTVPFFGFVMLMALGVDYSIFLLERMKEYKEMSPTEAIRLALTKMGGVILSAAVILGGTFAAMIPSGVLSLLQIATVVLTGLLLYAVVFLPLFVPAVIAFMNRKSRSETDHVSTSTSIQG
ncbi:MMPL family transporter [Bacillus fonticola]|uniref:MMPL family transporter n=1 Tax=Bacillus fonticola TaxID=2728853 RepID=UPI0014758DDE|nr:MMPL family transporter [Bacillus fonticola]